MRKRSFGAKKQACGGEKLGLFIEIKFYLCYNNIVKKRKRWADYGKNVYMG